MLPLLLLFLHLAANFAWIGSIVAVGLIAGGTSSSAKERGLLALGVYRMVAVPALLVSVSAGTARLFLSLPAYFSESHFMHAKLTFAVVVIALHHIIGARVKRLARGELNAFDRGPLLSVLLLLAATVTAFFAVYKPF
ncbi:MAG: hypothetical protein SFV15_11075 [Polyangiaceae bacterium]|nr:hypothetical protein [Polyangiaceae bacterium]